MHSPLVLSRSAAVVAGLLALIACTPDRPARSAEADRVASDSAGQRGGAGPAPLIPQSATISDVDRLVHDPMAAPPAEDSVLARYIQHGYRIVRETPKYAARYVGNTLSCSNCHMNAGQREGALPLVGVAAVFPQYRSRSGRAISLEDRIRGCFSRSMNGTPPPYDSEELIAVSAYIAWLSRDQPMGQSPAWRGKNVIAKENLIPIERLDVARGEQIYARTCLGCHGADGQGVNLGTARPGPLWGPGSWNDGAGAARVYTLAGYIRYAMPLTQPGSLSDEEAQHVAAYINSQSRPVFAGKAQDYPRGDVPTEAVYYPQRYPTNPLRKPR